jgi:hypothetical protein
MSKSREEMLDHSEEMTAREWDVVVEGWRVGAKVETPPH